MKKSSFHSENILTTTPVLKQILWQSFHEKVETKSPALEYGLSLVIEEMTVWRPRLSEKRQYGFHLALSCDACPGNPATTMWGSQSASYTEKPPTGVPAAALAAKRVNERACRWFRPPAFEPPTDLEWSRENPYRTLPKLQISVQKNIIHMQMWQIETIRVVGRLPTISK